MPILAKCGAEFRDEPPFHLLCESPAAPAKQRKRHSFLAARTCGAEPSLEVFRIFKLFPSINIFEKAKCVDLIEWKWTYSDIVHAIMPLEPPFKKEIRGKLCECYQDFYVPWGIRHKGLLPGNKARPNFYWYMAIRFILNQLRRL